jgi:hypothetical protein
VCHDAKNAFGSLHASHVSKYLQQLPEASRCFWEQRYREALVVMQDATGAAAALHPTAGVLQGDGRSGSVFCGAYDVFAIDSSAGRPDP